ncbi:hypothetical protein BG011_008964 [Mortierella polycephala]|uniref:Uncharacterized protein n=1 Tax=Mortierella polycephala TaxID=41804 RepID=A0A9P6U7X7_9FUNG|nr:hypothetical protein BG011_008964 [Mortierella polycephala]
MVSPRSPTSSFMSTLYGNSSNGSSKSPHTTVHSNYNVTISDFRTHSTIASMRSTPLPTKVTDLVFDRRGGYRQQDVSSQNQATSASTNTPTAGSTITSGSPLEAATAAAGATSDPVNKPSAHGVAGGISALPSSHETMGYGFRAPLRSLDMLNLATSSSTPLRSSSSNGATTTPSIPTTPTTPTTPTFGFNESAAPSLKQNKLRRGSEHSLAKDHSISSSKHTFRGWVPAALKAGFMNLRKKRPMPNHYLSLPVGGAASSPTNGMYMLHSEDLSVTEFAKLAGITILPERDDTTTFEDSMVSSESAIGTNQGLGSGVSGKDRQTVRSGSASAGNTLHTFRSVASDGSNKRANIWDSQFWTMPDMPHTGESLTTHPTVSSTSLPIRSGSSSLLPSSSSAAKYAICIPDSKKKWLCMSSGSGQGYSSSAPTRTSSTNTFPCPGSYRSSESPLASSGPRRKSCFPFGSSRPSVGSGPEIDQMHFSNPTSVRRVDQLAKPAKEAVQLSRDIGCPRSFTSLTAIAIELDGKPEPSCSNGVKESSGIINPRHHLHQQQQQHHAQPTVASVMPIYLEPSHPPRAITPLLPAQQAGYIHPAVTPTFHQGSRIKSGSPNRHYHPANLRARPPNSSRTRSPSPSPLSRQVDVTDSDGLNSPQDETAQHSEQISEIPTVPSPGPPVSRNQRQSFVHGRSNDTLSRTSAPHTLVNKHLVTTKFQDQGRPLPPLVSKQKLYQSSSTSSSSSSLSFESQQQHQQQQQQQHVSPRPPCSAPSLHPCELSPNTTRTFTPGTKVGRFTLVQETCTKHVDMLRAQQQQRQRRASFDAEISLGANGAMDDQHPHTVGPIEGSTTAAAAMNPMLMPEENVVIFQRKKMRRLQQPTPSTSSHKDIE